MSKSIWAIIVLALLLRLAFLFSGTELWWDSGVYVGMGKFLFSAGHSGLWEPSRPVVLPFMLGTIWFFGLDVILFGKLLSILFALGCVFLAYLCVREWYSEKVALIVAALLAFSPIMFSESFQLYTEIPALFFILLATYLARRSPLWSGVVVGIACLTKWPAGIFFPLIFFMTNKKIKYALGFASVLIPFLLINKLAYGSFLLPFVEGNWIIGQVLGCNVLRFNPWWFYFWVLFFVESWFAWFSLLGFWKARWFSWLLLLAPLFYFVTLHCRDYRYLILLLPFFFIFPSLGLARFGRWVVWLVVVISALHCLAYFGESVSYFTPEQAGFISFFSGRSGEVYSSSPMISLYSDVKINKIYYPVYNAELANSFLMYLAENSSQVGTVALENCGGGITCLEEECKSTTAEIVDFLKLRYNLVYNKSRGNCWYSIFVKNHLS